jgi:hypothetical protein
LKCTDQANVSRIFAFTRFSYPGSGKRLPKKNQKPDPRKHTALSQAVVNKDEADCKNTQIEERKAKDSELKIGADGSDPELNSKCSFILQEHN